MNQLHLSRRLGLGLLSLSMLLAACSTAAAPSASPPPASPSPDAPVTAPPSGPADPSLDPGDIGDGAKLVVPRPGQLDVRDIKADSLTARVDGSTIVVTAKWFSGVEPCNILDQVIVTKGDGTYAITLREGHGPQDVACIAIAELHKTDIAIQDVAPGTYTITDGAGGAARIEVTVG